MPSASRNRIQDGWSDAGEQLGGQTSEHRLFGPLPVQPARRDSGLEREPTIVGCSQRSAHVPGVAERVAPGLRPDREAMRLAPDGNLRRGAGGGVDRVDDVVVAAGESERLAVGADVAHVRAAPAGDRPRGLDRPRGPVHSVWLDSQTAVFHVLRPFGDGLGPRAGRLTQLASLGSMVGSRLSGSAM